MFIFNQWYQSLHGGRKRKKKYIGRDFLKNLVKKKTFTVRKIFSLFTKEGLFQRILVVLEIKSLTKTKQKVKVWNKSHKRCCTN